MNELKDCGIADILIAVVDGLKGFPDAINATPADQPLRIMSLDLRRWARRS